jgi:hypothetical protein
MYDQCGQRELKEHFETFCEDYNTATLPSKKVRTSPHHVRLRRSADVTARTARTHARSHARTHEMHARKLVCSRCAL